ncbi:MAG: hypothetical protein RLY23_1588 [Actinomycetota bacterium]
MPRKTRKSGSDGANGENPEPAGGESDPTRGWIHPSELGSRFDAVAAKDSAVETPQSSPSTSDDRRTRESRGRLLRQSVISCAALSIAFGGIALWRYTSVQSDGGSEGGRSTEALARITGAPMGALGGVNASVTSSIAAVHLHQGAEVSTISGICVKGGIVTASGPVSRDGFQLTGVQITVALESLKKGAQTATEHAVSVSSVDEVSGLAYLTGYQCPESQLSMEQARRWRSGEALVIAARPTRQPRSTQVRAQVFSEGGVVAKTQFGRTGNAVLLPILEGGSKQPTKHVTDSSAIGTALVNSSGEFMGVVIAEVMGSYLAIPSSMARRVISQFINGERVEAGWLGLELDTDSKVLAVSAGSPAQGAGILVGEQIYATDGARTAGVAILLAHLQAHAPGDRVLLTIENQGRTREVTVILGYRAPDEGS